MCDIKTCDCGVAIVKPSICAVYFCPFDTHQETENTQQPARTKSNAH